MKQSNNGAIESSHFEALYPPESRSTEIEKILKLVREGKSVQLVGLPGVGRSNLLGLLSYNKNIRNTHLKENHKWFHFVPIDFSQVRKKELSEVTKFIFLNLVESVREREEIKDADSRFAGVGSYDKINKIFKECIETNDELVIFSGLKRSIDFLSIEKELTVVFLFDRFEEYISILSSEFFSNLRVLRNRAKYRFSAIFSLNRPLDELIEPALFADFYEFLADNIIFLSILDKPGLDFRISYLEKVSTEKFDSQTIQEVLKLTGGHGKLTRLCLETVLTTNNSQLITDRKLQEFLLEQKNVKGSLFEIWSSLLPEEQNYLQKLVSTSEVKLQDTSEVLILEELGLIKNAKFTIPLFEEFIKFIPIPERKISFDTSTNDLMFGEQRLSDVLTSAEYRLLKYLLENEGRIIERDEIIKAVWKDEKTTEGVTDQAVDQLIFRLRKKIEDDPNNPNHVQTLKGRGLRFVS